MMVFHYPWWTPKNLWRNHGIGQRIAVRQAKLEIREYEDSIDEYIFECAVARLTMERGL